ncbi:acyl carrier protein [Streptomyces venezuelae]|nr:phosphopantetheine-binding protein [Streptomyces venezuelae]
MSTSASPATADLITGLLIDRFDVDPAAVRPDARMTELLVDSLMVVEMAIALKDELRVEATEDELRELTFAEFAARVDERRIDERRVDERRLDERCAG